MGAHVGGKVLIFFPQPGLNGNVMGRWRHFSHAAMSVLRLDVSVQIMALLDCWSAPSCVSEAGPAHGCRNQWVGDHPVSGISAVQGMLPRGTWEKDAGSCQPDFSMSSLWLAWANVKGKWLIHRTPVGSVAVQGIFLLQHKADTLAACQPCEHTFCPVSLVMSGRHCSEKLSWVRCFRLYRWCCLLTSE